MTAIAALACLAWLVLFCARGGFWRADQRLPRTPDLERWPAVVVVVPARDEAQTVRRSIASHALSDYPGRMDVILVDDHSTDATVAEARAGAEGSPRSLEIVSAPPLEPGWNGKLWALHRGLEAARRRAPDAAFVLLTDADIVHGASLLRALVARAVRQRLDLVSVMARLDDSGTWGGLLVPAFVFFFQKLYPFPRVNDPRSPVAGAAGGVVLVRREALDGIGGIATIRAALIDDCALAARIKHGPPRRSIELVLSDASAPATSLRENRRLASIHAMVARTAFTQLNHSALQLGGAVLGMLLLYLAGPLLAVSWPLHGSAPAAVLGATAWGLAALAYVPTLRLYGRAAWQALALPLAAALYTGFTVDSALRHWRGRGAAWKGRLYHGTAREPA